MRPLHTAAFCALATGCSGKVVVYEDDVDSAIVEVDTGTVADTSDEPFDEPDPDPWDTFLDPVAVPGGSFEMGCTRDEDWNCYVDEFPVHQVNITEFTMWRTEVPRGLYRSVMGAAPQPDGCNQDDCPVVDISWLDAVAFCNALSELAGLEPVYTIEGTEVTWDRSKDGWRLPTEAEWEYAARAGRDLTYAGSSDVDQVAWYDENSDGRLHETGEKNPNDFGLHDLSGNAWEWTWNWLGAYTPETKSDPAGELNGDKRVIRGGSYDMHDSYARVSLRRTNLPDGHFENLGFRIARGIPEYISAGAD